MLAKDLIKDTIPPLKLNDTAKKALRWMEEFRVRHLPVVKGLEFLGLISDNDLLSLPDTNTKLGSVALSLIRPYITDMQHVYEAVRFVSNNSYSLIPVITEKNEYVGVITIHDLVECFADLQSAKTPGGIIVMEFAVKEFSLAEVSQVVEANNAMIMSSGVILSPDNSTLELTIKINKVDLTRMLAAFYRYNFNVKAYYHQSDSSTDMQERYDSFMNYLNM